jgi:hypothetical protein
MGTAFLSALAGDMEPYLAVIELRVTFVSRRPFQKRPIGLIPPGGGTSAFAGNGSR